MFHVNSKNVSLLTMPEQYLNIAVIIISQGIPLCFKYTATYIYIYICIYIYEGKINGGIEVTGRRGRERRKLLDDLKERKGYSQLKEEALDITMWRASFGDRSDRKTRKKT